MGLVRKTKKTPEGQENLVTIAGRWQLEIDSSKMTLPTPWGGAARAEDAVTRRIMMRWNPVCQFGLSIAVCLTGLSLASWAAAQTAVTPPSKTTTTTPPAKHSATAPATGSTAPLTTGTGKHGGHSGVGEELRRAHHLLVHADHDYDGHRAKAAHAVHMALEELGHHHHHSSTSGTSSTPITSSAPTAGSKLASGAKSAVSTKPAAGTAAVPRAAHSGSSGGHESQAASDTQLREAEHLLQASLMKISTRHPGAAAHVKHAIAEINVALTKR